MGTVDLLLDRHAAAERTPFYGRQGPIVTDPLITALAMRCAAISAVFLELRKMFFYVFAGRTAGFPVGIPMGIHRPTAPDHMFTHIIVTVFTEVLITTGAFAYSGPDVFSPADASVRVHSII